jgi:pimeloyl-ACP methyl ester carboxylesterase
MSTLPVVRSIASADGTSIGFSRSGAGRPLVLVHGTSASRSRWEPVLPSLERRFTVYAMDRRGRGSSGDGHDYSLEREVEDVESVVQAVGEPLVLLGHSWGGICALEAAGSGRITEALEGLILYEPPIPVGTEIYPPGVLDRLAALLDSGEPEAVVTTFLTEVVRVPREELELMRAQPAWPNRVAAAHTLVREVRADDEYGFEPDRWRQLELPTLLLLGGDSPPFFGAAIDALHSALPNGAVRVMAGQQHAAMDTAPELFVREVVRFVEAVRD